MEWNEQALWLLSALEQSCALRECFLFWTNIIPEYQTNPKSS